MCVSVCFGVSVVDLKSHFGVDQNDLQPYLPADPNQITKKNIDVHYLGYYLKWHPQACYYFAVENSNFKISISIRRTFQLLILKFMDYLQHQFISQN